MCVHMYVCVSSIGPVSLGALTELLANLTYQIYPVLCCV